jgi:hypothetical protein
VRTPAKILPLGLAVAAALSIGASAGAAPPVPSLDITLSFTGTPSLSVENASSGGSGEVLSVGGSQGSLPPPARVAVDVPAGYTPDFTAAPGAPAGIAFIGSSGQAGTTVSSTTIFGLITVADPAQYQSNPAAQACAPGPYLAVWSIDANILGVFKTSLPIFVVRPSGSTTGIELRFCAPTLTNLDGSAVAAPPLRLDIVSLLLSTLTAPTAPGSYLWHAYVAPQTPGTGAPNDAATYEVRALVPVPHAISVKGSYNAKLRDAVLTGRVTEGGKAQANATVFAASLTSLEPIRARTNAAGRFTIKTRVTATTTFFVQVPDQTEACQGASTAPAGCASTTVSASASKRVRVVVPRS